MYQYTPSEPDEFSSLRLSSPRKKHLGGETIRLNSSPSDCCIHLVQYGVACLGDELKFAQAAGIKINIPSLCRYRTHLLYWAAMVTTKTTVTTVHQRQYQKWILPENPNFHRFYNYLNRHVHLI